MVYVFMQIFFMQRVMRMEFCPHNNVWTIIMYVHAVCDMSSKSSACVSALVITSLWDATLDSRDF